MAGYMQKRNPPLNEEEQRRIIGGGVRKVKKIGRRISSAEGGAGNIESPGGTVGTGAGATIRKVSDALPSRRKQGIGAPKTATNAPNRWYRRKVTKKPRTDDVKAGPGVASGEGFTDIKKTVSTDTRASAAMQGKTRRQVQGSLPNSPSRTSGTDRTYEATPSTKQTVKKPPDTRPNLLIQAEKNLNAMRSGQVFQDTTPTIDSSIAGKYKQKAGKFGPSQGIGGRDVYEMKDGERTGRILESSSWLKDGNAFSSNAWEKTVGGQPNQGYDPNAIMPEGYYQEGGTFIHGPRDKLGEALKHAQTPEERKIILTQLAGKQGDLDPATGMIGSELGRRGEQKLEGIKGRYLEGIARINANADVTSSGLTADAYAGRGGSSAAPKGYQSVTDPDGNLSVFNKDTGTYSAPGAELPEHIKQQFVKRKFKSQEEFENELQKHDEITRKKIRALMGNN